MRGVAAHVRPAGRPAGVVDGRMDGYDGVGTLLAVFASVCVQGSTIRLVRGSENKTFWATMNQRRNT